MVYQGACSKVRDERYSPVPPCIRLGDPERELGEFRLSSVNREEKWQPSSAQALTQPLRHNQFLTDVLLTVIVYKKQLAEVVELKEEDALC